jgi:hypothetical protein
MSTCELQDEVSQLYAMVKQLTITTEKLNNEIRDIRKEYATIMVNHTHLYTHINYIDSLVTRQPEIQNRQETPESPRSPASLVSDEDKCR